ncbi:DedA family protein [Nocardioides ginsengisoli]|uniref:DedA family protein n=1 Tax=Nocardioides ginsengisoli TaxID=363868 RepID=A0ABW3W6B0_9ACTN
MTALIEHLLTVPTWLAVLAVFVLPALESSIFLGFVFPGEIALLLGGVLAGQGHAPVVLIGAAGIAGAIVGDAIGYVVGRRWGRRILDSAVGRFIKPQHLDKAEHALSDRGGWAVLVGRFTVALRVLVPGLAGMGRMPYPRFALSNVAGAIVWGSIMVTVGYLAGASWRHAQHLVSIGGIAFTVGIVVVLIVRHVHRRRTTVEL